MFGVRAASATRAFARNGNGFKSLFQRSAQRAQVPLTPAVSWSMANGSRCYSKDTEVDAAAVEKLMLSNTSIEEIEKDIAKMLEAEAKELKESEGYSTFQMQKKLLENNGYSINVEYNQYVTMSRTDNGRTVALEWSTVADEGEEEEDEDANDLDEFDEDDEDGEVEEEEAAEQEEEEASDDESGSDVDSDDEEGMTDVPLRVTITKGEDADGAIVFNCTAGSDGQLYVESMGPAESQAAVETDELPTELTHRVYDYLEQLGIGNGTATFVQHFNYFADADREVEAMDFIIKNITKPK